MIPFTFPSSPSLVTGNAECKIFYLSSVTGLAAWKDYIPVRSYTSSSPVEGTTDAAGYQAVKPLSSTTGLAAWTDYIPVYEDASLTKPWSTDAGGYIPVGAAGSRLSLNFAGTTAIDSRITFTRASNATYFNSSGVLTTAGNNAPRLDYDPATLLPRGLLIEEQRTNSLLQSVALTNATWTAVNSPSTVLTTGLDGVSTSAAAITATAATSGYFQNFTPSAGQTYCFSKFVKAGTGATARIGSDTANWGASVVCYADFNPSTQTFSNTQAGVVSSGYTSVGNGWYRAWVTGVAVAAVTSSTLNYINGNGLSVTIYGPQVEAGAFPTSYIPTTTASATRSADSASMTLTNFSSWYSQTQGTFVVEFDTSATATVRPWSVNDNTASNRLTAQATAGGFYAPFMTAGGAGQVIATNTGSVVLNTPIKTATSYSASGTASSAGGSISTAGAISPPTVNQLQLGTERGLNYLNGHIRRLQFYPVALPSATLQTLTA